MNFNAWHRVALIWVLCFPPLHIQAQSRPGVELDRVEIADIISEVSLNGTVNALRTSRLSTAVAGLVEEIRVETGNNVVTGDLLVGLDNEQAELDLASARAETAEARSRLEEAQRRLTEARSVGAGRNIAATEISARESEVAATEAALARLRAEEKRHQVVLDRHRIEAPFDGVVSNRISDLGEWVNPGDELLTLVDTTNLRLDFRVPQNYYQRISDDSELFVTMNEMGLERVTATIESLVPVNDPQARTFLMRATAPEKPNLLPGMAVQATLRVSTGKQGLTVSRDAINRYPDGRITVWIAEPTDNGLYEVREKRVEVGSSFSNRMEILSGLEGDEQVVIRGNESLEDGARVKLAAQGSR